MKKNTKNREAQEDYIQKLLKVQNEHQNMMHRIVIDAIEEQEGLVHKLYDEEHNTKQSFAEKLSDIIASFGGSWMFIISFFTFLATWMMYNNELSSKAFDPYPYILLNLILSCIAAIQAPIILMSQNRKESRDRKRAQDDYLINLKSELENRMTNQKLDLLINEQFKELIEIQRIQIEKLDETSNTLEKHLNKTKKKITGKETTKSKKD